MSDLIEIKPNLAVFLSSFRQIGYKIETAVSDIVDNSISANAKNVRISVYPSCKSAVIFDDGTGMSYKELTDAMRLGTHRDIREAGDLGKFGLGLKTASFSQTKKFTVLSKKGNKRAVLQWDMDLLKKKGEWVARKLEPDDVLSKIYNLDVEIKSLVSGLPSYTVVFWEEMDQYSENPQPNPYRR
jgi:hypothetical protein